VGVWNQVVTSLKWLEDEVELVALYNTKTKNGSGKDRSSSLQRGLLSAAIGRRLSGSSISNLSGILVCCFIFTDLSHCLGDPCFT